MPATYDLLPIEEYGKKKKYEGSESSFQAYAIKRLRWQRDHPLVVHTANERNTRTITTKNGKKISPEGMRLKAQGVVSGMPDIMVYQGRGEYLGLAIELKRKGGRVSDNQRYVLDRLKRAGWKTAIVWSQDGLDEVMENYWSLKLYKNAVTEFGGGSRLFE